jgi:hypothetical protein
VRNAELAFKISINIEFLDRSVLTLVTSYVVVTVLTMRHVVRLPKWSDVGDASQAS